MHPDAGGGDGRPGNGAAPPEAIGHSDLNTLVARYVGQLLHGCQSPDCTLLLCHSGRINTSDRPVRRYTPTSARAFALAVCSGPNPRKSLCRYYTDQTRNESPEEDGQEHDVSSLMQSLCSTSSLRNCTAAHSSLAGDLHSWHQKLDWLMLRATGRAIKAGIALSTNAALIDGILPCVQWLLERLSAQRTAVWRLIDSEIVSKGRAYPQTVESRPAHETYNNWLAILDVLDSEPYLRLLRRVVQVLCVRMRLEHEVCGLRASLDGSAANNANLTRSTVNTFVSRYMSMANGNGDALYALVVWLKKLFAREWNSTALLTVGSLCHGILEILAAFQATACATTTMSTDAFMMPLVRSRLTEMELAQPYLDDASISVIYLLDYPFLLPVEQLFLCFRMVNHLVMRQAHSQSLKAVALRQKIKMSEPLTVENVPSQVEHSEEHYFLLSVTRTNILRDTFDQLWQRRKEEIRRPLRIRLGQADELEVGHDLGGVQIEFFNLVCREILAEDLQMFVTDSQTGLSFFKPCSLQPLHTYELLGILFALAIYNGITLPIRFPNIFYHILMQPRGSMDLDGTVTAESLQDGWPAHVASLQAILREDVYGLDFEFPVEANGLRLSVLPVEKPGDGEAHEMKVVNATPVIHHADPEYSWTTGQYAFNNHATGEALPNTWPGWTITPAHEQPVEVTGENKEDYVKKYAAWVCYHSVAPQFDAFRRGFHDSDLFHNGRTLSMLGPAHLKAYIEGTDTLDMADLKAVTRYDGYDPKSKYMQNFWKIVTAWPETTQKQLLKFVTAAERLPVTGVSNLVFMIKRVDVESLDHLPTSSTCFGTLMLPRYASAEILQEKLGLALKFGSEGFGTG